MVRSTESGDFHIVLCDDHFLDTSEQYVLAVSKTGTMIVSFTSLNFDVPQLPRYLDLESFVKLVIAKDVMIGDYT